MLTRVVTRTAASRANGLRVITKTGLRTVAAMLSLFLTGTAWAQIGSVVSATGALPFIAPNTWIEIRGSGIVPATGPAGGVIWTSSPEFAQGLLPTQIGGVSVTVNNKSGFVYFYCSAATTPKCTQDQINVLTPLDFAIGPVEVRVTSVAGSFGFTVTMMSISPGFFQVPGTPNILATHADGTPVGGNFPAVPGEMLVLYGNGFGNVVPPAISGSAMQKGVLTQQPQIQIGGIPVITLFAGLVSPGVFQFNILVPSTVSNGYLAIDALYQGTITQSGVVLLVRR
jgi:uncharacterized protein (TIGR03437 family)